MSGYALVTPLRNEADNIARLFSAMSSQTLVPETWVIIDDSSSDGSRELIEEHRRHFSGELIVQTRARPHSDYALGEHYASLISSGFELIKAKHDYRQLIGVGICDADCFPKPNYFALLMEFLNKHPRVGLTSGLDHRLDGKPSRRRASWVRGNCRLWRRQCLDQAGYLVGPSADTTSLCSALLHGWQAKVEPRASFAARELGARSPGSYYGRSAHYRGLGIGGAIIKTGLDLLRGRPQHAGSYLAGYLKARASGEPQIPDPNIRRYYRYYPLSLLRQLPTKG